MRIDRHTMTPGDVARVLGVSAKRVQQLDAELQPVRVDGSRHRRYDPRLVELASCRSLSASSELHLHRLPAPAREAGRTRSGARLVKSPRKATDRRTQQVLAALAAAQAHDDEARAAGLALDESEVDRLVGRALFGSAPFDNWPAARMRELIAAACVLAPSDTLDAWAKAASETVAEYHEYALDARR